MQFNRALLITLSAAVMPLFFSVPVASAADVTAVRASSPGTVETITSERYDQIIREALADAMRRDYAGACAVVEGSLPQFERQGNQEWYATMLSLLGSVYQRLNRYSDSEESLKKSIAIWTRIKGPDAFEIVGSLANLGALYYEAGLYANAERLLARAIDIEDHDGESDQKLAAMLVTNLGSIYFSQHKDDSAQQMAEKALEKFEVIKNSGEPDSREGIARNYALLGAVALHKHELPEAETWLKKALEIWKAVTAPDDPRRAEAVGNLAIYYLAAGDLQKSESLFKDADSVFKVSGGNNAYLRHFFAEYHALEEKMGRKKDAKKIEKRMRQLLDVSAELTLAKNIVDVNAYR